MTSATRPERGLPFATLEYYGRRRIGTHLASVTFHVVCAVLVLSVRWPSHPPEKPPEHVKLVAPELPAPPVEQQQDPEEPQAELRPVGPLIVFDPGPPKPMETDDLGFLRDDHSLLALLAERNWPLGIGSVGDESTLIPFWPASGSGVWRRGDGPVAIGSFYAVGLLDVGRDASLAGIMRQNPDLDADKVFALLPSRYFGVVQSLFDAGKKRDCPGSAVALAVMVWDPAIEVGVRIHKIECGPVVRSASASRPPLP